MVPTLRAFREMALDAFVSPHTLEEIWRLIAALGRPENGLSCAGAERSLVNSSTMGGK